MFYAWSTVLALSLLVSGGYIALFGFAGSISDGDTSGYGKEFLAGIALFVLGLAVFGVQFWVWWHKG